MENEKQCNLKAYAKINLGLDVLRRREDGYHDVCMVMQSLALADDISIWGMDEDTVEVTADHAALSNDESNLAYRAAKLLKETCGLTKGVGISIQKRIPMAAGLAGGSADAAAVLRGMNRLFGLGLSIAELRETGVKLGADVPFCITGGCALAEGIGEKLTDLPVAAGYPVLLAKPDLEISTKYVYEKLSLTKETPHPDIRLFAAKLRKQGIGAAVGQMGNLLETVTAAEHPVIGQIKARMLDSGALNALMSGSGPTVFGVFQDEEGLRTAYDDMVKAGLAKDVIMTSAVDSVGKA